MSAHQPNMLLKGPPVLDRKPRGRMENLPALLPTAQVLQVLLDLHLPAPDLCVACPLRQRHTMSPQALTMLLPLSLLLSLFRRSRLQRITNSQHSLIVSRIPTTVLTLAASNPLLHHRLQLV